MRPSPATAATCTQRPLGRGAVDTPWPSAGAGRLERRSGGGGIFGRVSDAATHPSAVRVTARVAFAPCRSRTWPGSSPDRRSPSSKATSTAPTASSRSAAAKPPAAWSERRDCAGRDTLREAPERRLSVPGRGEAVPYLRPRRAARDRPAPSSGMPTPASSPSSPSSSSSSAALSMRSPPSPCQALVEPGPPRFGPEGVPAAVASSGAPVDAPRACSPTGASKGKLARVGRPRTGSAGGSPALRSSIAVEPTWSALGSLPAPSLDEARRADEPTLRSVAPLGAW
mmetsp:Transcript_2438/g.9620  ORF Transcript_2438/g.9620 Transcript_2438/m.9620 type:complete len:284 (+) Transcript_2438:3373-4224(+)